MNERLLSEIAFDKNESFARRSAAQRALRVIRLANLASVGAHLAANATFLQHTLHKRHEEGANLYDGKPVDERVELAKCKDGERRWVTFYRDDQLAAMEFARTAALNEDRVGLAEAMREGISKSIIDRAATEDTGWLGGGRLDMRSALPVKTKTTDAVITVRPRPTIPKSKLPALKERKVIPAPEEKDAVNLTKTAELLDIDPRELRNRVTIPPNPDAKGNHRSERAIAAGRSGRRGCHAHRSLAPVNRRRALG